MRTQCRKETNSFVKAHSQPRTRSQHDRRELSFCSIRSEIIHFYLCTCPTLSCKGCAQGLSHFVSNEAENRNVKRVPRCLDPSCAEFSLCQHKDIYCLPSHRILVFPFLSVSFLPRLCGTFFECSWAERSHLCLDREFTLSVHYPRYSWFTCLLICMKLQVGRMAQLKSA